MVDQLYHCLIVRDHIRECHDGIAHSYAETLIRLHPSFAAVNLEDISAPRCFEIEKRVIEVLDCPVMHDDQHGTAIVALAALKGAVKVQQPGTTALRVVISGARAAGVAYANIRLAAGIADVTVLDSKGIVSSDRGDLNEIKTDLAARTNPAKRSGGLVEALDGADVFLGVSAGTVPAEIIATVADDAIIFAMSNPDPESHPDVARKHAVIVATGRSDFPNQINNVLAFLGVFKDALDAGVRQITEGMKLAAAEAILSVVADVFVGGQDRAQSVGSTGGSGGCRGCCGGEGRGPHRLTGGGTGVGRAPSGATPHSHVISGRRTHSFHRHRPVHRISMHRSEISIPAVADSSGRAGKRSYTGAGSGRDRSAGHTAHLFEIRSTRHRCNVRVGAHQPDVVIGRFEIVDDHAFDVDITNSIHPHRYPDNLDHFLAHTIEVDGSAT